MMRCESAIRWRMLGVALAAAAIFGTPCCAEPLVISVAVPEGNYRVTVELGDAQRASSTTVKSENRRLML